MSSMAINGPEIPPRHCAIVTISEDILLHLLETGEHSYTIQGGIPAGARVTGVRYDAIRSAWQMKIEHESLPTCQEAEMVQEVDTCIIFPSVLEQEPETGVRPWVPRWDRLS